MLCDWQPPHPATAHPLSKAWPLRPQFGSFLCHAPPIQSSHLNSHPSSRLQSAPQPFPRPETSEGRLRVTKQFLVTLPFSSQEEGRLKGSQAVRDPPDMPARWPTVSTNVAHSPRTLTTPRVAGSGESRAWDKSLGSVAGKGAAMADKRAHRPGGSAEGNMGAV